MNKYTILKSNSLEDLSSENFFRTYNSLRAVSPRTGISTFTMNENLQMTRSSIMMPIAERTYKFPEIARTALPTNRDFSNLINQLDVVTSSKNILNKESILHESEQLECIIEEGDYHYIKIQIKGKRSPLRIHIKKNPGKVTVFSSFFNQKPTNSNYDQQFSLDSFEIRNLEPVFRFDFLHLGIRAKVYSKISISVNFGRNRTLHAYEPKEKKKNAEAGEDFDAHKPREIKLKKKQNSSKNFIEENLKKRMLSPDELFKKNQEWNNKRQLVLKKKKIKLEEKKAKALAFLNRQQIRSEQIARENEMLRMEGIRKKQAEDWICFLYLIKASNEIDRRRYLKRKEIAMKLSKNTKVRTIQRFYRKTTKSLNMSDLTLVRARTLLLFYHNTSKSTSISLVKNLLIDSFHNSAKKHKPIFKFNDFFARIVFIQKSIRTYLEVKSERIRKLIIFWDQCKSFQIRRSIKKKIMVYELNISIYQRSKALHDYYSTCVKKFYRELRAVSYGLFISEVNTERPRRKKIAFEYMPSVSDMKAIIDSAQKIPDRTEKKEEIVL